MFVFCLFIVGKSSLGCPILRTGLVSIMETVAERRRDLFSCDELTRYRKGSSIVSNKWRYRRTFLEAHFLYREVNICDDGRFRHLGLGVAVLLDLAIDKRS